ncbi:Bardet-Biedl syndrome 1 protein [Rhizophlyctis rosea]|uniref:Bardet-Biedl syndrome 1 protein n=1 Tax=Rhizophlyctis rosea TaxID=64517 RepID=A0AAD5XA03_9FUNG|nr:Bardet-Biedl syndrome 1 protein [Rhizophlyctis rosea]
METVALLLPPLTPAPENLLAASSYPPTAPPLTLSSPRLSSKYPRRISNARQPAQTPKPPPSKPSFLPGLHDPLAGLHTLQPCVVTADLSGKGDHELVVCAIPDFANGPHPNQTATAPPAFTLKPYPPTLSNPPVPLPNPPAALQTFHSRTPLHASGSHRPVLALSSGSNVRIYESNSLPSSPTGLSPTFTFTLPPMIVNAEERRVWERMWEAVQGCWARVGDEMEGDEELVGVLTDGVGVLKRLQWEEGGRLTPRSEELLNKGGAKEWIDVVKGCEGGIDYLPTISSMTIIKQSFDDVTVPDCLVIGTEEGMLVVLDTVDFTVKHKLTFPHAIAHISVWGLLPTEHSVVVVCRNWAIYRFDCNRSTPIIDMHLLQTRYPIIGITAFEHAFVIATMDDVRILQFSLRMPSAITVMTRFDYAVKGLFGYAVGLESGEIRVYRMRDMIFQLFEEGTPRTLHFLPYGREPLALITTSRTGGITINLLKRTANFDPIPASTGKLEDEEVPIQIGKKGRAWQEGVEREKSGAKEVWERFEAEISKLKVLVGREYVKGVVGGRMKGGEGEEVKVECELKGRGPKFLLRIRVTNSTGKAMHSLRAVLHHEPDFLEIVDPVFEVRSS